MLFSDYLYAKASERRVPLSGGFELSPVCNFSCRMCYVRKTPGELARQGKRLRTSEEWLALAEQCRDAGMLYLLLSGGEPFAYPGFRSLYERLHELGLVLSVNSNGSLIDEDTVAWLKERMPSRLNITLYGASAETYGSVCGNPSGYEKTVRAVELLREAGIPVVLNVSMIPENNADLEKMIAFGLERGINTRVAPYMFPPVRRAGEAEDSRSSPMAAAEVMLRKTRALLSDEEYRKYLQKVLELSEQTASAVEAGTWGESFEEDHMHCRAGRCSFWVNWDGSMTACALTGFPRVTYPFDRPFAECWREINEAVLTAPVLAECAGCSKKHICKPCAAMMLSETGDENKKAPYLCEMADCVLEMVRGELEE